MAGHSGEDARNTNDPARRELLARWRLETGPARFLAEASRVLASSLDYETTLQSVADLAVPLLADWCFVDVVEDDGAFRRCGVGHADPEHAGVAARLRRGYAPRCDPPPPAAPGTHAPPHVAPEVSPELLAALARDDEHLAVLRALGLTSLLSVPLVARGGTLGTLTLASTRAERRYGAADVPLAEDLAHRAALAIDNARLYREAQVALADRDASLAQLRRSEQERARLYLEAQEANHLKDEFLATVSHELRTPLTAILGWVRMLRSGVLPDDKRERALATIERNARAQMQLVEDLLDVSRITSGKLRLSVTALDPSVVVEMAMDAVRPAADAREIRLHAAFEKDACTVMADADRLQQVAWNLLANAIKFTPRGGTVQVRLRRDDMHVELAVADTGQGIPLEFLPHVFERFRQADGGLARSHGGLGLGLSIAKHLIELHGGTVHATSDGPGRGATFVVRLPAAPSRVQPAPRPATGPLRAIAPLLDRPVSLAGLRILVVDDEADARDLLVSMLEARRAVVHSAADATDAFARLQQQRPDVLLSDIGMAGEDGLALVRRVRALPPERGGRTPAIALTAHTRTEDRARALLAGFDRHLPKPIEPAELVAVIAALAGRHAGAT